MQQPNQIPHSQRLRKHHFEAQVSSHPKRSRFHRHIWCTIPVIVDSLQLLADLYSIVIRLGVLSKAKLSKLLPSWKGFCCAEVTCRPYTSPCGSTATWVGIFLKMIGGKEDTSATKSSLNLLPNFCRFLYIVFSRL